MTRRHYITTAIDYPNAAPHMGHVLEKVLADVCARWFRLRGDEVRFQVGTDEHGVKIARKAKEEGLTPRELVDRNVPLFKDLYAKLQISNDAFVRTTDQEQHWPTVEILWKHLQRAGKLEKRAYTGLYCSGCERFLTKKDLDGGTCAIHKVVPEEVTEENYFFSLSKDAAWLKKLLTSKDGYRIVPSFRAQETLSLIEQGLEDVSFSRPKTSLDWGIPVPDDPEHVMYVWCDALTNYISGLGFFTDHEDRTFWDSAEITHVIGKDIARFHALIWPAMLKAAGVKIPERLLIHGFLTSEGEKMSKSLGNVVNPQDVIAKYGVDALRFYLSHEVPVGRDGDFSWERFGELYDSSLRNNIGNLLNRVIVMMAKLGGDIDIGKESVFIWGGDDVSGSGQSLTWDRYESYMNDFDCWSGIHHAIDWADACNKYINDQAPWSKTSDEQRWTLSVLLENLRHIALMLLPFIPETAQKISKQLNVPYADTMLDRTFVITDEMKKWGGLRQGYGRQGGIKEWKTVGEPEILFPPVE